MLRKILFPTMVLANLASTKIIVFDTWDQLSSNPSWNVACDGRNYGVTSDHKCINGINATIPLEDLNGESGFWSGCYGPCILTYNVTSLDQELRLNVYLNNADAMVIRNGVMREVFPGDKWSRIHVGLDFTSSVGIYIPEVTMNSFIMLDKILVEVEDESENTTLPLSPNITTASPESVFSISYFKHLLSRLPLLSSPFAR